MDSTEIASVVEMIPQLEVACRIQVLDLLSDTILCHCGGHGMDSARLKLELLQAIGLAWQIVFLELFEMKDDDLSKKAFSTFMFTHDALPELTPEFMTAREIMKNRLI